MYVIANGIIGQKTVIDGNHATSGTGGGIYGEDVSFTVDRTAITNNTSGQPGGGLSLHGGDFHIGKKTTFSANSPDNCSTNLAPRC